MCPRPFIRMSLPAPRPPFLSLPDSRGIPGCPVDLAAHRAVLAVIAAALAATLGACAHRLPSAWTVADSSLDELSGLAASHRHADVLWTLEDGGNPAELVAIDTAGRRRAALGIAGARNVDWEDLARFDWNGQPHLLVADVGDNDALRPEVRLLAVAEPDMLADARLAPVWNRRLVWSDGPRDCESVVVDADRGEILLVSKRTLPPRLYVAALPPAPPGTAGDEDAPLRAEFAAPLAGVPVTPEADIRAHPAAAWRHQPTGAALSPDGRRLAVTTSVEVLVYARRGDETWAAAVSRTPLRLPLPPMPQAEAVTWSSDGRALLVGGEQLPIRIHRLPLSGR